MNERLVAGIIVDTSNPAAAARLLDDLAQLADLDPGLGRVSVVLLENPSGEPACASNIDVHAFGLPIHRVDRSSVERDLARGWFGRIELTRGRWPIATARTVLQRHAAANAMANDSAVWILDEDLRLSPLLDAIARGEPPLSERIRRLRNDGTDVAVGPVFGAPPVPARTTVRVNIEDIVRHLDEIDRFPPDAIWPDRAAENARVRLALPEYYYDLSRAHADAGAHPMWLEPRSPDETVRSVFARLGDALGGLLDGVPVTRALPDSPPLEESRSPLARGGNTLVLRPELLARIPNIAPRIGGRVSRRSDMLWARLTVTLEGARFARGSIAAFHDRHGPGRSSFDADKLLDDLRGSALVAALESLIDEGELSSGQRPSAFAITRACTLYVAKAEERLLAIHRSEARALALLQAIADRIHPGNAQQGFLRHPTHHDVTARLREHVARLRAAYARGHLRCEPSAEIADVERFFASLPDDIDAYRSGARA